jgi:rubredoxin
LGPADACALRWAFYCIDPIGPTRERKNMGNVEPYRTWMCNVCGFIYEESEGWPEDGIAPGTRWEAIPANWSCPECGARKEDFEMIEI